MSIQSEFAAYHQWWQLSVELLFSNDHGSREFSATSSAFGTLPNGQLVREYTIAGLKSPFL